VTNPFDDDNGNFVVLVNQEGQYSLWPHFVAIPEGWEQTFGPEARQSCLDHIEQNWVDMRPKSLVDAMENSEAMPLS